MSALKAAISKVRGVFQQPDPGDLRTSQERVDALQNYVEGLLPSHLNSDVQVVIDPNVETAAVLPANPEEIHSSEQATLSDRRIRSLLTSVDEDHLLFITGKPADTDRVQADGDISQINADYSMQLGLALHEVLHILKTSFGPVKELLEEEVDDEYQEFVDELINCIEDGAMEREVRVNEYEWDGAAENRLLLCRQQFTETVDEIPEDAEITWGFLDGIEKTIYDEFIHPTGKVGVALDPDDGRIQFRSDKEEALFRKISDDLYELIAAALQSRSDHPDALYEDDKGMSLLRAKRTIDFFNDSVQPCLEALTEDAKSSGYGDGTGTGSDSSEESVERKQDSENSFQSVTNHPSGLTEESAELDPDDISFEDLSPSDSGSEQNTEGDGAGNRESGENGGAGGDTGSGDENRESGDSGDNQDTPTSGGTRESENGSPDQQANGGTEESTSVTPTNAKTADGLSGSVAQAEVESNQQSSGRSKGDQSGLERGCQATLSALTAFDDTDESTPGNDGDVSAEQANQSTECNSHSDGATEHPPKGGDATTSVLGSSTDENTTGQDDIENPFRQSPAEKHIDGGVLEIDEQAAERQAKQQARPDVDYSDPVAGSVEQELAALDEILSSDKIAAPETGDVDHDGSSNAGAPGSLEELKLRDDAWRTGQAYADVDWGTIERLAAPATETLEQVLDLERQDTVRVGQTSGTLNSGDAYKLGIGDTRVFGREVTEGDKRYLIVLILDRSVSMRGRCINAATKALGAFAHGAESLGAEVAIVDFFDDEARLAKPASLPLEEAREAVLEQGVLGGTPLADALHLGKSLTQSASGNTQPVVISVTDGKPSSSQMDRTIAEIEHATIPMCGITIAVDRTPGNPPAKAERVNQAYDETVTVYKQEELITKLDEFAGKLGQY